MTQRMSDAWYRLLRSVHYLGYHTKPAMSYDFEEARPFSLVTSNEAEVKMARELLKGQGSMQAAIWVIEGAQSEKRGGSATDYYLREVFHPTQIVQAVPENYPGAKKTYDWTLTGTGQEFGRDVRLNDLPWFPEFFDKNGNFGFGLRVLKDQDVRDTFIEFARLYFTEK